MTSFGWTRVEAEKSRLLPVGVGVVGHGHDGGSCFAQLSSGVDRFASLPVVCILKSEEIRLVSPRTTNTYPGPRQRGRRVGSFVVLEMTYLQASGDTNTCWCCWWEGEW